MYRDAAVISGDSGSVTGSTFGKSMEVVEAESDPGLGGTVWYKWTATTTADTVFAATSVSNPDDASTFAVLALLDDGSKLDWLENAILDYTVAFDDSSVIVAAEVGSRYAIRVLRADVSGSDDFTLTWAPSDTGDDDKGGSGGSGGGGSGSGV
jgi:hypothetical protein